jgi:hypothetical protein
MSAFANHDRGFFETCIKILRHNDWGYVTHPYNYDNWKFVGAGSFLGGSLISALLSGRRSDVFAETFVGPTILSLAVGAVCFGITVRPRAAFVIITIQSFFEIGRALK